MTPAEKIVPLPDCAASRRLIELTSHATDLSEAAHTLQAAEDAGEGSALWLPLTMHAVTAYIRPFIHSNVRRRLDEMDGFPGVPPELDLIHQTIRGYRNATVAHSQSDLSLPLALAVLSNDGTVEDVIGWSLIQPMPQVIADQLVTLVAAMETTVELMTEPVLAALRDKYRSTSAEAIGCWPRPAFDAALDTDFTAARRRTHRPYTTLHWHHENDPQEDGQP